MFWFFRNVLFVALILILSACTDADLNFLNQESGGGDNPRIPQNSTSFSLFEIQMDGSNVLTQLEYSGDDNNDNQAKVYFCSTISTPGCNPLDGISFDLSKFSGEKLFKRSLSLADLSSQAGDILNYQVVGSDPDSALLGNDSGAISIPNEQGPGELFYQLGFNTMGMSISNGDYGQAMAIQSDGKILIAGESAGSIGDSNAGSLDAVVLRFNPDGSLDKGFSGDGAFQLGLATLGRVRASGVEYVNDIELDNEGNIYVSGYTGSSLGDNRSGAYDSYVFKLLPNGSLDLSFGGSDGIAQLGSSSGIPFFGSIESKTYIEYDTNHNQLVLAGSTTGALGDAAGGSYDFFIARLNMNGELDSNFGNNGITQLGGSTSGTSALDRVHALVLDNEGKAYLVGETGGSMGDTHAGGPDAVVAKFNTDGTLDTDFGSSGILQLGTGKELPNLSLNDKFTGILLTATGELVVTGQTYGSVADSPAGSGDIFFAKFNSYGTFDTTFGVNGYFQLGSTALSDISANGSGADIPYDIIEDKQGKLWFAGTTTGNLLGANAGFTDIVIGRLTSSGALDTSFNGKGILHISDDLVGTQASSTDESRAIGLDDNGNALLAGYTNGALGEANHGTNNFLLARLNANGSFDPSFSDDGLLQVGFEMADSKGGGDTDIATASALTPEGDVIVVGQTESALRERPGGAFEDAFILKHKKSGELDASFANNGILQLGADTLGSAASGNDYLKDVAVNQTTGDIYAVGYTSSNLSGTASGYDIFIVKLKADGSLDHTFSSDGIVQVTSGEFSTIDNSGGQYAYGVAIDDNDKIVVVGMTYGDFDESAGGNGDAFIMRFNDDGTLDTNFQTDGVVQFGQTTMGSSTPVLGEDKALTISINSNNEYIVAGTTKGELDEANGGSSIEDLFVMHINRSGAVFDPGFGGNGIVQLGTTTLSGGQAAGRDYVTDLVLDSSDNIYISGYTYGNLGGTKSGATDAFVVKFDKFGALDSGFGNAGIMQFNSAAVVPPGTSSGEERIFSLQIISDNTLILAGSTHSSMGESTAGGWDALVMAIDSTNANFVSGFGNNGIYQWGSTRLSSHQGQADEMINSILVQPNNGAYIFHAAGFTESFMAEFPAGNEDIFWLQFDHSF